jgi:hypothetical protein
VKKKFVYPLPQTAYSWHQEFALALCRAAFGVCPFNSIKDGSANCDAHVRGVGLVSDQQCEPGARTQEKALEYTRMLDAQEKIINGAGG